MTDVLDCLSNFLVKAITYDTVRQSQVQNWFTDLASSLDVDDQRFLICLAIDLRNRLIEADSVISVLEKIDFASRTPPLIQFDQVLLANPHLFTQSNCCDCDYGKEKYVGVVNWSRLFKWIAIFRPEIDGRLLTSSDDIFVYHRMFSDMAMDLEGIEHWNGFKGLTWLVPFTDMALMLKKYDDPDAKLEYILDSLGLEPKAVLSNGDLDRPVLIEYPDILPVDCYQPTCLCGMWLKPGGLYISYRREDGHGRTRPTTGQAHNAKERVMQASNYGGKACVPHEIGIPGRPVIADRSTIIQDALKRFRDGH